MSVKRDSPPSEKFRLRSCALLLCFFLGSACAEWVSGAVLGQTDHVDQVKKIEQDEIIELIYALDEAASITERKKIFDKLVGFGERALDKLQDPPDGLSRQTELLLAQVKSEIEKSRINRLIQATPVSLSGKYSLHAALQSISKETGVVFKIDASWTERDKSLEKDFTLKSVGYWLALDQVLDAFGADISSSNTSTGLRVIRSKRGSPRADRSSYDKRVRTELKSISVKPSSIDTRFQTVKWDIRVEWEPLFNPYLIELDYASVRARLSDGKDLLPSKADRLQSSITTAQSFVDLQIPFKLEKRGGQKIKSLSGDLILTVPLGRHSFTFLDLTRKELPEIRKADAVVKIESTSLDGTEYQVDLLFALDRAGRAFDSHQGWMFQNRAYLLNQKGTKILPKKLLTTLQEKDKMGFSFIFELPGGPAGHQFIYETPTSIRKVPVKFDLKRMRAE